MGNNDLILNLKKQIDSLTKENSLLKSHISSFEEYELILSATSDLMSFIDTSYTYRAVNQAYLTAHGKSKEEIIGKTISQLMGEDTFEVIIKPKIDEAFKGKKVVWEEWINFNGIGKRYIEVTYYPYIEKHNSHNGIVVRARDLTKQKNTEDALLETEKKFRALDENLLLGFLVVHDIPAKIVYANNTITEMTGYTVDELIGFEPSDIANLIHRKDRKVFIESYPELLQGKQDRMQEIFRGIKKNGEVFWAESFSSKIEFKGKPALLIAFKDVTERRTAEKAAEKYVRKLRKSKEREKLRSKELALLNNEIREREKLLMKENANKDKFFSIISHDLRSPFTALLGYAQLLEEDFDNFSTEELKTAINAISKISRNIFSLIEGLLEWSRTRTGRIDFNPEIFDVYDAIKTVKMITQDIANKKSITIEHSFEPDKIKVLGDLKMVDTILRNLVTNALKFTPNNGMVKIYYEEIENEVIICVEDNGIGISEEDIGKLFQINIHHTTLGTNKEIGTGLGLMICKELVEKNNGTIWVESQLKKGSIFKFTLPKNISSNELIL